MAICRFGLHFRLRILECAAPMSQYSTIEDLRSRSQLPATERRVCNLGLGESSVFNRAAQLCLHPFLFERRVLRDGQNL